MDGKVHRKILFIDSSFRPKKSERPQSAPRGGVEQKIELGFLFNLIFLEYWENRARSQSGGGLGGGGCSRRLAILKKKIEIYRVSAVKRDGNTLRRIRLKRMVTEEQQVTAEMKLGGEGGWRGWRGALATPFMECFVWRGEGRRGGGDSVKRTGESVEER